MAITFDTGDAERVDGRPGWMAWMASETELRWVDGWMDKVDGGEEETGLPQSKVGSVDKSPRLITRYYSSFCVCAPWVSGSFRSPTRTDHLPPVNFQIDFGHFLNNHVRLLVLLVLHKIQNWQQ